jgi:AraC-like DNA-binding protein
MTRSKEWVRLYRLKPPYETEMVHAHYVEHRFARHSHEHFVVGLVEEGVQHYTYQGASYTTPPGQTFFVNGDEPHTGKSATADGYLYRTLCLDPETFRQLTLDITGRNELPYLAGTVVSDTCLFARLQQFHKAVAANADAIECESFLLSAVQRLLEVHVENRRQIIVVGQENSVVSQVRDYIEGHYSENVSLAQLGSLTSRSPFQIARAFSKTVGLPPHAYLESVRMRHAREMLKLGMKVIDTALATGYPDQSHFTHRFRSITGITPAQYAIRVKYGTSLIAR